MPDPPKVTTKLVAEAAGVTTRTVSRWVKLGLLPAPKLVYGALRGKQTFWPASAVDQARWVRAQIEAGQTWQEVKAQLDTGAFPTPPDAG